MKMKISLARVDKRTLHATVALNWNRFISVQWFIVVDDSYQPDPLIEQIMRLTIPNQKVCIVNVESFMKMVEDEDDTTEMHAMVIFKDIHTLYQSVVAGFCIKEVQFQDMTDSYKAVQKGNVFTKTETSDLKFIHTKGIKTYFQTSPYDDKKYF